MIFQKQLFKHNPPHTYGDCWRTVIACFLNRHPTTVPNFGEFYGRDAEWKAAENEFFATVGLAVNFQVFEGAHPLEKVLEHQKWANPGMYYVLSGQSKNGTNHVVICLDDKIIWDPAIDDSGIVGPRDDGYWVVERFVPSWMNASPKEYELLMMGEPFKAEAAPATSSGNQEEKS